MIRVLTVCVGNVCRSPLAERLLAARAAQRGLDLQVGSAGVRGLVGQPMDPQAAAELVRLGGVPDGFAARRLEGAQVLEADLVLVATKELRAQVLQEAPAAMRRVFTLVEFAALCDLVPGGPDLLLAAARSRARVADQDLDLADPIGRGDRVHREVADRISGAVDRVLDALVTRESA